MKNGPDPKKAPGLWAGIRLLLPFARFGWGRYVGASLLAVVGTAAQYVPYYAAYVVLRDVIDGTATQTSFLHATLIAAVGVAVMVACLGAASWMSHRAAFATLEHLRLRIGKRLGTVPLGYLTRNRSGAIQRTLNDDIERLESFLAHAIPDLVSSLTVVVGVSVWLLVVDLPMGLVALSVPLVCLPLMAVSVGIGRDHLSEHGREMARMNASIVEFVRGLPIVRTFQRPGVLFTETSDAIKDATRFQAEWGRCLLPYHTTFYTLLTSNVVVLVPAGLWMWQTGRLNTADLVFFFIIGLGYTTALFKLLQLTTQLGRLGLGAALVHELDQIPVLPEVDDNAQLGSPSVEFDNVTFSHLPHGTSASPPPDAAVTANRRTLEQVCFTASPGQITAIVGPSGAGKSTLLRLISRFADVDSGTIRVCDVDVRDMPLAQLTDCVALVQQETFLFDDTVAANLQLAQPNAVHTDLETAAKAARAHDFIMALPHGYDTPIGERGSRLSGGERQRLSIARALLKDAPVVLLDEVTAHVDPDNEVALQEAMAALATGRTVIVVAHRLSTIVGANHILVMDDGRIVEQGGHDDLLAAGGLYTRLWEAFIADEEADLVEVTS